MGLGFQVADASQHLAITGVGIPDIKLAKKAWVLPGQKVTRFDLSPENYSFQVQAMSAEKLPFVLPAVFTIGPRVDDKESLVRYARLIAAHDKQSNHVNELVQGVIEGETRVLAASMTMEEIFKGTKEFKKAVFENVQLELNQFGLVIYNANVKQLVDVPGHEYFSYLGQKTQQEAVNRAKVEVAEERMKGSIGEKLRDGQTKQNAAKVDAETMVLTKRSEGQGKMEASKVETEVKIYQNQRAAEVAAANAELIMKQAEMERKSKLAEVEAAKAVAIREAELQLEVEKKNVARQTEKLRAEELSKALVDYDKKVQEAEWLLVSRQKAAEAQLYEQQREAEARRVAADASFFTKQRDAEAYLLAKQKEAEAALFAKHKEAEGISTLGKAEGEYLSSLLTALGGNYGALRDFLLIKNNVYQEMARVNAEAVKGMSPKISVWSNGEGSLGGGGEGSGMALKEMAGVYRMLPPLLQTVQEQTGMQPPPWLGSLPAKEDRGLLKK